MITINSNILYGRRYRLLIGSDNGSGLDVSQLRCTFNIEKSMAETPNYSEINIYNLSAKTENTLISGGQRVVLEAGYEGEQYGLIFDGNVIQSIRYKEHGTDYKLTLVSQDGDLFLNSGIVSTSLSAGQTQRTVVNEVTSKATNPIELHSISESLDNNNLIRGKVVFGLAKDYLHQIAKTEQAVFYVNDGKVNIVKATDLPTGQIVDLSPTSGLIGTVEQFEEGIKAKCLLNPLLNLNTFVHIDNNYIRLQKINKDSEIRQLDQDGIYRIIKIKHTGDSRGNEWYTEFTAITQCGEVPVTGESMR